MSITVPQCANITNVEIKNLNRCGELELVLKVRPTDLQNPISDEYCNFLQGVGSQDGLCVKTKKPKKQINTNSQKSQHQIEKANLQKIRENTDMVYLVKKEGFFSRKVHQYCDDDTASFMFDIVNFGKNSAIVITFLNCMFIIIILILTYSGLLLFNKYIHKLDAFEKFLK
ncbi:hypothetical protein AB837_00190 [bacterium AB1]|nr:hypothetical protein AB837_00190 [bacterium AB1]